MAIIDQLKRFKNFTRHDGEFGIEIETETKAPYDIPSFKFWNVVPDGSLRDFGQEYVLKQPLKFKTEVPAALDEFASKTSKIPFITDSHSSSVHVHVNMNNEKFMTFGNFTTIYALVENLLMHYAGPDRLSNCFCLPMIDAQPTVDNLRQMFRYAEAKQYKSMFYQENAVKYAALNLSALNTYGSIELRQMRGDPSPDKILEWLGIVYKILEFSRKDITPHDILGLWRKEGMKTLDIIFEDLRPALHHKDENKLVDTNLLFAARIAMSVKDWRSLDKEVSFDKDKYTQKQLDKYSIDNFTMPFGDLSTVQQNIILQWMDEQGVSPSKAWQVKQAANQVVQEQPWTPTAANTINNAFLHTLQAHTGVQGGTTATTQQPVGIPLNPIWIDDMPEAPEQFFDDEDPENEGDVDL